MRINFINGNHKLASFKFKISKCFICKSLLALLLIGIVVIDIYQQQVIYRMHKTHLSLSLEINDKQLQINELKKDVISLYKINIEQEKEINNIKKLIKKK